MISLDSTTIMMGVGIILIALFTLVMSKTEDSMAASKLVVVLALLYAVFAFVYMVPLHEEEHATYYSDNIREAIITNTSTNITYYEKLIRIETVCRIYDNIPIQKCIDYAIADIQPMR